MSVTITNISRTSFHDGPGIRTVIYFNGCKMACVWCHNPEGQNVNIEYYRSPNGCLNCDNCLINGKLTEKSINACKRNLVRAFGEDIISEKLTEKILKNAKVLSMNGGGVTFSGGEPTLQHDFLIDCLNKLKGKVHTCIQTTGFTKNFSDFLPLADMFLYDIKLIDNDEHKKYCGQDNKIILENYKLLASSSVPFITRVALIPGVTDTEKNLNDIALFLKENNVKIKAELMKAEP